MTLAQDGKDGNGVKLEKIGYLLEVWTRYIPKIPEIIIWGAFSGNIYFMFSFCFIKNAAFELSTKFRFQPVMT